MSGSKSDYLEAVILNGFLGGTAIVVPSSVYIALSLAAYADSATGTAMTEVSFSSTGYTRVAVGNNTTNWPAATGTNPTTKTSGAAFTFPTATGSWGTILAFYICDAASGGNVLYGADLSASKTVNTGDTATFAQGQITVTED